MAVELHDRTMEVGHRLPRRLERKYYVEPAKVGLAYGILRHTCRVDAEFPSEQIHSLYFDTAELDEHEKSVSGEFQKDKIRLRWYGADGDRQGMQTAFLELKSRQGFASTKQRRRLQIPVDELEPEALGSGVIPWPLLSETLAGFGFFPTRLLQPVIAISYWRYRFREVLSGQGVSLDTRIRSTMILPRLGNGEADLELPGAVMEVKGTRMELPGALIHTRLLETDWTRYSKYSACIDAHTEEIGAMGRLEPSGRLLGL